MYEVGENTAGFPLFLLILETKEDLISPLRQPSSYPSNSSIDIADQHPILTSFPELCQGELKQWEIGTASNIPFIRGRSSGFRCIFHDDLNQTILKSQSNSLGWFLHNSNHFSLPERLRNIDRPLTSLQPVHQRFLSNELVVKIVSHHEDDCD